MARSWLAATLLCFGCGATAVEAPPPKAPVPARAAAEPEPPPAESPPAAPATSEPATAEAPAPSPPALEAVVEAGEIPRPTLLAVLSAGVPRFLQKVSVQAKLDSSGRRFLGWTLRAFEQVPGFVLVPGDTVLRVNGQSIERPEQFKNVWDSLATESELVLLVERGGQQSQVRYRITD